MSENITHMAERFYDRNDTILQLAAALRRGDPESVIDFQGACREATTQSLYAQTLAAGSGYLQAAGDFFAEKSDGKAFLARIKIS